ncbi:hypothetical protein TRFO_07565 [Tritrichomonas foetus]|uniref:Uncharacterized protein n=1 Tax=Tritrichomonas foetus TaxID=1144522 RepID=A0A1J4JQE5_9EUKA|nr:hypothetical protein TRFO_07565 [Tritrichomonas foetus]|eukprot:OHT01337.1 hypothetical protein TRFO_07565 [Tritrichomonas foetus]
MSELTIRRSAPTDAKALSALVERIGEILVSRYNRKDLSQLLEDSILSFTVLSENQPVAVACFVYPDQELYYSYRQLKLSFYAAETQHTNEAARLILRTVFESQPCIDTIITAVAQTSPLESALVPFFIDEGDYSKCSRETVLPSLVIRAARVEDYDDLMPLFEAEAPDLIQQYGQFFVSDLIKSTDTKCLVAEGNDGLAVAFVGLEPNFDPSEQKDSYDLDAFQDLFKEQSIAFRIRIFFIAEEYRNHSRDFMKPIFSLMRDADYCLMFLPTNSPPFPLAPFFTRIPALEHGNERFVLFMCHRDSVTDVMLNVRQFSNDDYSLLENFIEPLSNRTQILEICNEHPECVYQLMANEIIAGICLFKPPEPIDHQKWDIEQYVEIGACSKHCQLLMYTISPIFQRFFSFFLVRCQELLNVHALYYMHTGTEMLPDLLGTTFLAIERRQGPAPPTLEKHLERLDTMHLFARKHALQPKYEINTSIVVVGSTEAVSSFVYKLISVPYLHFSAIHVVCTGGAERVWVNTAASREYSPDWLQHLHLLNAVNFFEADLAEIERDEAQIILNDGSFVSYDFLILLTAKEGEIADMWMAKNFVENTQPPVSVVGDSLVAYYILSHYPGAAHIAHNPRFKLEGTMATIIRDSTVAYCDFKEVPPVLLGILERSFLVYDGGIVIDELFRTNDTKIFAAGPITQFSRLYRVKDDGNIISQTEYGNQIGGVILKYVDPLDKFEEPPPIVGSDDVRNLVKTKGPQSVPKFSTRRAEMYQLPGNRTFYRNGFPSTKCRCLETSKSGQTIRFFIDAAGFIQAFEYLGDADSSIFNWMKFIGLPGVLLNNMIERYDKKMITDFKAFFNEPWCAALLHDRFPKFFEALHRELVQLDEVDKPEVHNEIRQAMLQFLIDNADLLPHYYTSESQLPPLLDDDDDDPK